MKEAEDTDRKWGRNCIKLFFKMKRILLEDDFIQYTASSSSSGPIRWEISLTLSCCFLPSINAFQKQERGRAILATQTWIKSNGISLDAAEIVHQTLDACEAVSSVGDQDVIMMVRTWTALGTKTKRGDKETGYWLLLSIASVWTWNGKHCRACWLLLLLIKSSTWHEGRKKKVKW